MEKALARQATPSQNWIANHVLKIKAQPIDGHGLLLNKCRKKVLKQFVRTISTIKFFVADVCWKSDRSSRFMVQLELQMIPYFSFWSVIERGARIYDVPDEGINFFFGREVFFESKPSKKQTSLEIESGLRFWQTSRYVNCSLLGREWWKK